MKDFIMSIIRNDWFIISYGTFIVCYIFWTIFSMGNKVEELEKKYPMYSVRKRIKEAMFTKYRLVVTFLCTTLIILNYLSSL